MTKENLFIFRPEWFTAYDLDNGKNFLQSPVCPCGCGEKSVILLDDFEALKGFAIGVLMEYECYHCAIFMHGIDDMMYAFIKMLDDNDKICISYLSCDHSDYNFFKDLDNSLDFHCYGLLIESQAGQWKIIED